MPAITTHTMADQAAVLRLLAWLSPAFPTGAYAYSHGLEWSAAAGDVTDGASLRAWIEDLLVLGSGRSDAILLRHAHRAAMGGLGAVAELAEAAVPARERLTETLGLGAAFAAAAAAWDTIPPAPYPVAVGALAGRSGIAEDDALAAYLQAVAANLVSAGVRLIPLGQSAGLTVLAALEPTILATTRATRDTTLDDIGGACWRSDIAAMRHETQYTRLFRT
jgi:urease accessory protein